MNMAIMRTQKIKSIKELRGRARHNTREIICANVDKSKSERNMCFGAQKAADVVDQVRKKIEECKKRGQTVKKDAVLAVEYVLSASPAWWKTATSAERKSFVKTSVEWLQETHGKENIVSVYWHRDENSEHLHAFIVPVDPKGRLNCKHFLGGPSKLTALQTSFAEKVGVFGLYRGLQGSKARHTTLKQFGAVLEMTTPKPSRLDYIAASFGLANAAVEKMEKRLGFADAMELRHKSMKQRKALLDKREADLSRIANEAEMSKSTRERMQKEIDQLKRDNEALRKKVGVLSPTQNLTLNY